MDLEAELPKARERVGEILGRYWAAVEAIADVLLERKMVYRPAIERVVTRACPELRGRSPASACVLERVWKLALLVVRSGLKTLPSTSPSGKIFLLPEKCASGADSV
jgi:hypothetical protein